MAKNNLVLALVVFSFIFISSCAAPEAPAEKVTGLVAEEVLGVDERSVAGSQPAPTLIDGKTLSERLAEAYGRLHTRGSAAHIRKSFPDIKLVYTDDAVGMPFPREIIPFRYYYSREADTTFNICAVELTVFICKGKLDHLIRREDVDSGRCEMTPIYGDPRL